MIFVYFMPRSLRLAIMIVLAPPMIVAMAAARYGFEGAVSAIFVCSIAIAVLLAACRFQKHVAFTISIIVAILLGGYIYIPHWLLLAQVKTPRDHLVVGDDYLTPGKLYGDQQKGWEHYTIAADGGNAEAQFNLGEAYLYGLYGITRDREKARYWLNAAAAQGYREAEHDLPDVDKLSF